MMSKWRANWFGNLYLLLLQMDKRYFKNEIKVKLTKLFKKNQQNYKNVIDAQLIGHEKIPYFFDNVGQAFEGVFRYFGRFFSQVEAVGHGTV